MTALQNETLVGKHLESSLQPNGTLSLSQIAAPDSTHDPLHVLVAL